MAGNGKMKTFLFTKHYHGHATEDNFTLIEEDIPELKDREYLLESICLSVDPYMRAHDIQNPSTLNKKMFGTGTGRVIKSKHLDFPVGTVVSGGLGWATHVVCNDSFSKIPFFMKVQDGVTPYQAMGVLGLTGLTAYFGLLDLCNPKEGETVYVNAAAGAVGNLVGQIAKIKGCRVVGSAGSQAKLDYLKEIGFDECFNYKTVENVEETLKKLCPSGIDCFFDNVGGPMFSAVLRQMNQLGRVTLCGSIHDYNVTDIKEAKGTNIHLYVISKNIKIEGFMVTRFMRRFPEGVKQLLEWINEGKLKSRDHVMEGFENMPKALMGLFTGDNIGKLLVKV